MRTSTPVSTISYNTDEFLTNMLNTLMHERIIEFWIYINHIPESDEKGKYHKHLYFIPSGLIDTFVLSQRFEEFDLLNPDKPPLACKVFRHSSFVDWYLYALHDKDYLAKKCNREVNYTYTEDDFVMSDELYFCELKHQSDFSKYKNVNKFRSAINSGLSFRELAKNGFVPIQQINQWEKFFNLMRYGDEFLQKEGVENDEYVYKPMSGGGGSFKGVPFMGTRGEPAQGELLYNDFDHFTDRGGEIHTMYPVYDDALPFDVDSEIEKNPPKN